MRMNSKEKGDKAIGAAIQYFIFNGYEVCLPIGDKRRYDFIVEKDGLLQKVQVKYAGLYAGSKACKAGLRITGGNQSFSYSKKYAHNDFDLLFVFTERGTAYCIPWKKLENRNEISVETEKYRRYRV
ncbi:MAG: hypothetical protein KGH93_03235 [Patescibacteria group bacterium]|nr:hypothetical protein [Patescibacteria group bacterium]MDE1946180.1 hypothetical protein [Patescibacteria group bacterium]